MAKPKSEHVVFSDELLSELLYALVDNNCSLTLAAEVLKIPRRSLYDEIAKNPEISKVKQVLDIALMLQQSEMFKLYFEGLKHPDLNIRFKYMSKLPDAFFAKLAGLDPTALNTNNTTFTLNI